MLRTFLVLGIGLTIASAAHADTLIVGNKYEDTISFIDLASGKEVARRETGKSPHEIAVSPDGSTAVLVSYQAQGYTGNSLHVFDVGTATKTGEISLGNHRAPHGLKWLANSDRVIATTEETQDVAIADVETGELVASIKTGQKGSHMVALSTDAKRAFIANIGSGSFTVIDLETQAKITDVQTGRGTEAIAVTPNGEEIWVGNNGSKSVMVFSTKDFAKIGEFKTKGQPIRVELSPDGAYAIVSQFDLHSVAVYDAKTYDLLTTIDFKAHDAKAPITLLFSPEGDRLWVAATHSAKVVEINTADWTVGRILDAGEGSDGLAYSSIDVATSTE